eukprot:TRINITY_DN16942_c0_g2_i1.p1 TRINITY_DN16942_c0_g2~~TRINITY_DN16942_c0_g2_i1.p1  ORF type:complete len:209 (-),score=49.15 TRINITY_DN16942_c0_g2_i1:188-814(-)
MASFYFLAVVLLSVACLLSGCGSAPPKEKEFKIVSESESAGPIDLHDDDAGELNLISDDSPKKSAQDHQQKAKEDPHAESGLSEYKDSEDVYLVEFYHPLCGTCQHFGPIFDDLKEKLGSSLRTSRVAIDQTAGERLAEAVGALDEGIPNLRLFFKRSDEKGKMIMAGEEPLPTATDLKDRIERVLGGPKALYLKSEFEQQSAGSEEV